MERVVAFWTARPGLRRGLLMAAFSVPFWFAGKEVARGVRGDSSDPLELDA